MNELLAVRSQGTVPRDLECFQDHFPDFPVLPGVLALDLLRQLAEQHWKDRPARKLAGFKRVRFQHFLRPGDPWEGQTDLISETRDEAVFSARLKSGDKVAVTATLLFH